MSESEPRCGQCGSTVGIIVDIPTGPPEHQWVTRCVICVQENRRRYREARRG